MTLRLIGLMSVVLLLSLAAFGLLMSSHQDQVMQEVTRTVSEVGRATLRGMELHRRGEWKEARPIREEFTEDAVRKVIVTHMEHRHDTEIDEVDESCTRIEGGQTSKTAYFINVEAVRVEKDPASGMVLTIPKLTPAGETEQVTDFVFASDSTVPPAHGEIRLPIGGGAYDELYESVRSRSILLFCGVFVVGMVLSAGVATRFTRPIRKLDGAIRRLSSGDLDVSVAEQGTDEVGRLSRAFNEMAGQLRANRERARELGRRDKLSALGRLAAGVAHDVRNPLHSIGLTLQHLDAAARPELRKSGEEFDRSLEIIRGEIRRLDQLVGNFLRFAKSERRERDRIDLGGLFREVARLVQKEAERRGVDLELQIDEAVPPILADGEPLRSSVLNLVLNSFEAMPGGGRLTLVLRMEGDDALMEVVDTGKGIPEDDQEHVFDFAYTTREGGNGLGLAMVHHFVVEEHGGRVSLDSRPGEGTRVRLVLPVQPRPERRP